MGHICTECGKWTDSNSVGKHHRDLMEVSCMRCTRKLTKTKNKHNRSSLISWHFMSGKMRLAALVSRNLNCEECVLGNLKIA